MRHPNLLLLCGLALGASLAVVACSAEDSGAPLPRDRSQSDDGTPAADDPSPPSTNGGTTPKPSNGSTDAGTATGATDASVDADAAAAPASAFTGAAAYAAPGATPGNINEGPHTNALNRSTANAGDPAGAACSNAGCHTGGREFLFGGTVYTTAGAPAANVEVRIRDAAGTAISVYSNAQGNFYRDKGQEALTGAILTGARNAASTHPMITPLTAATLANCNGCHTGLAGQTARITVK